VVIELSDIPRVTGKRFDVRVQLFFCDEVQGKYLYIVTPMPTPIFPKRICTTHIKKP